MELLIAGELLLERRYILVLCHLGHVEMRDKDNLKKPRDARTDIILPLS